MFSYKYIVSAFAMASYASAAVMSADTAAVSAPSVASDEVDRILTPTIIVCSGSINPNPNGCITIPVVSQACTSLTGGLTFLDKAISSALIPEGFACTFFSAYGCLSTTAFDRVILTGGIYDFFNVPGNDGPIDFNDVVSSFTCSPV